MGDWWIDPPRNTMAGGVIVSKASNNSVYHVSNENQYYQVGFECVKEWGFPLDLISDHYESYYNKGYVKFKVPTLSGEVFSNAILYVMVAFIYNIQVGGTTNIYLKGYYRSSYDATKFPWSYLKADDQSDVGWTEIGSLSTVASIQTNYNTYGPYWVAGLDVTTAVQTAISSGWEWIGFKFELSHKSPIGWDYNNRPTSVNQLLDIRLQGAMTTFYSNNKPPNHPSSSVLVTPWLKNTYSVLPPEEEQEEPGEDHTTTSGSNPYTGLISCIAADPFAKSAIAGTTAGGLWYCWSGGGFWEKVYEVTSEISAVYMDYVKNLLDYPNGEIAWFGTADGRLFKSVNSLGSWSNIKSFASKVVEIRGSELESDKVAVGLESDGIHVTLDGGVSWQQVLAPS